MIRLLEVVTLGLLTHSEQLPIQLLRSQNLITPGFHPGTRNNTYQPEPYFISRLNQTRRVGIWNKPSVHCKINTEIVFIHSKTNPRENSSTTQKETRVLVLYRLVPGLKAGATVIQNTDNHIAIIARGRTMLINFNPNRRSNLLLMAMGSPCSLPRRLCLCLWHYLQAPRNDISELHTTRNQNPCIMKKLLFSFLFSTILFPNLAPAQGTLIGGPCEGCEAIFEYGDQKLSSSDTLPGFQDYEPKLKITGTIYEADGETPAEGVILYVYHTDLEGEYPTRGDEEGWAQRHGYIRGWVQTGADGKYTIYTFKPGSYSRNPAHIHPTILEPNGDYYWLGSFLFEGDPNITDRQRNSSSPRGGSNGILQLKEEGDLLVGQRDFVLGKNVQD